MLLVVETISYAQFTTDTESIDTSIEEVSILDPAVEMSKRLVEAAYRGNIREVQSALASGEKINGFHGGPSSNFADKFGGYPSNARFWTPLLAAVAGEQDAVATYLIGKGARCDVKHPQDVTGYSALLYIANRKTESESGLIVAELLLGMNADPHEKINVVSCVYEVSLGNTPALRAKHRSHKRLSELFARAGSKLGAVRSKKSDD